MAKKGFTKGDHSDLVAALDSVDPREFAGSDSAHAEWAKLGAAWKTAGLGWEAWDAWNQRDPEHYDERANRRQWDAWSEAGSSTGRKAAAGSVARLIREHHGTVPTYKGKRGSNATGAGKQQEEAKAEEPHMPKDPCAQLLAAVERLFRDGEGVNIVTKATPKKKDPSKYDPVGYGVTYDAAALKVELRKHVGEGDAGLEAVIGSYDHQAGVWWRANPMDGDGTADANVTRLDHALLECDEGDVNAMVTTVDSLGIPYDAITFSGNHSAHVLVYVGAGTNRELYAERVATLYQVAKASGIEPDTSCRNPSKLSRLPGATRGDRVQWLIGLGEGVVSWADWRDGLADALKPATNKQDTSGLPHAKDLTKVWDNLPPKASVIVGTEEGHGFLRRAQKGLLTGPSKSAKSWGGIELAVAVATGGAWFGYQCAQGKVLYCNFEIDGRSFAHRLKTVAEAYGADGKQVAANVFPLDLRGHVSDTEGFTNHIIAEAQRIGGVDLVIVDPLYMYSDADENSASETKGTMALLDKISEATGAATFTVHHHAKYASGAKAALDRGSGSGVFGRAPDAIMDLSPLDVPEEEQGKLDGAQPFRATLTLREFAPQKPFDVYFKYPLHFLDLAGTCKGWEIVGADPYAQRDRAKRKKAQKAQEVHASLMWKAYQSCLEDGTAGQHGGTFGVTASELWEHIGKDPTRDNEKPTRRSIENWAQQDWCRVGRENVSTTSRTSWVYYDTEEPQDADEYEC